MKIWHLSLLLPLFGLVSCMQLPFGSSRPQTYKNVSFKAPTPYFVVDGQIQGDQTWVHSKTGALISYKSECPATGLSLPWYLQNLTSQFVNSRVLDSKNFSFNGRKAHRMNFTGEVEGVTTEFDLVAFKKYDCLFLLSHSGLEKNLKASKPAFEGFIFSFSVLK